MQFLTDNWGSIALFGGLGGVIGFLAFAIYAKFSASTTDDEWAARIGSALAYAVKLTPTTTDDQLLAKVNEFLTGLKK